MVRNGGQVIVQTNWTMTVKRSINTVFGLLTMKRKIIKWKTGQIRLFREINTLTLATLVELFPTLLKAEFIMYDALAELLGIGGLLNGRTVVSS